jgi:hypothetical protein
MLMLNIVSRLGTQGCGRNRLSTAVVALIDDAGPVNRLPKNKISMRATSHP